MVAIRYCWVEGAMQVLAVGPYGLVGLFDPATDRRDYVDIVS